VHLARARIGEARPDAAIRERPDERIGTVHARLLRQRSGPREFPRKRAGKSRYDALVSIDVPAEKARAVIDALERDMGATLATKADIQFLKQEIDHLRKDVERDNSCARR
jgi:hypothetical protein